METGTAVDTERSSAAGRPEPRAQPAVAPAPDKLAARGLRIVYAAGPGDVIETYRHWKSGELDPRQVSLTYSAQFYDLCRGLGAQAYVIATFPGRQKFRDGNFRFEYRALRGTRGGAIRFHLGQLWFALRLVASAIRYRADVAVVGGIVHFYALAPMRWFGVQVVPTLHSAFWPSGFRPRRGVKRILQSLNGRFWRKRASATVCVSDECERQIKELCAPGLPRGPIFQARAQYRRGSLDQVPPARWPDPQSGEPFRVLYTGRLERDKGIIEML